MKINRTSRIVLGLLMFLLALPVTAGAQEPVGAMAVEPTAGVIMRHFTGPRIGDVMPEFMLPDAQGKLWSSKDQLGQRALVVLICNMKIVAASPTAVPDDILDITVSSINRAMDDLSARGVLPVMIFSGRSQWAKANKWAKFPQLFDPEGALLPLADYASQFTLLGVDRAGFLRRKEVPNFADWQHTGGQMLDIGDTTPKLEVGQPAPDFATVDEDGNFWKLSEMRGRPVLLTFTPDKSYYASDSHIASLLLQRRAFHLSKTQVLTVYTRPGERIENAVRLAQRPVSFPRLPDTSRNLCILYGALPDKAVPAVTLEPVRQSVLIDKDGIVRLIDRNADIKTHGADIVAQMQKLGWVVQ